MARIQRPLAQRLESLTGQSAGCCVEDYASDVQSVTSAPGFAQALARAKAMADPQRLTALGLLQRRGEMCACELQAALGLTHGTISHHMGALAEAGLVKVERKGRWAHYTLAPTSQDFLSSALKER